MPEKYHLTAKSAPPRYVPVGRHGILDHEEACLKCHHCVKKRCLYDVYRKRAYDQRILTDSADSTCKNCLACVQNCHGGVLGKTLNPEFLALGDSLTYTPEVIETTWRQAETGKIPVSGAGYRGPFSGPGFDSMWTDMSEIVRPTRDGIHGREYISAAVDIGRKLGRLRFDAEGRLLSSPPPLLESPLPVLFNTFPFGELSRNVTLSAAEAARACGLMMYATPERDGGDLAPFHGRLIPVLDPSALPATASPLLASAPMIELAPGAGATEALSRIRDAHPGVAVSVRLPASRAAKDEALRLARAGFDCIHLMADPHGFEHEPENPRRVKDVLREVHTHLVSEAVRDEVTLIVSGGIALAEHLAKAVICGADLAAIDVPLLVALECRVCGLCERGKPCPVALQAVTPAFGARRIENLMCAWWSQLIEVMGAMGIRDIRRMRGEAGRAMFFEDLEREAFGPIFGKRKDEKH